MNCFQFCLNLAFKFKLRRYSMVRGELSQIERATMSSLVTIDVHGRDVVVQMHKVGRCSLTL
jgi:hypothetical protein